MKERKKIKKKTKLAGFSMLEMIVAIFIFAMIMTVAISVFVASYRGQKKAKEIQQGMENSRVAIELMAKNIRMGRIDSNTAASISFYNYSQGKCIKYEFSSGEIKTGETNPDGDYNCGPISAGNKLVADLVLESLNFNVVKSSASVVGRVTISLKLKNSTEPIQTTVSLRDYIE
jgi:prepilin-type N-terminal cleavage/methylation domain-containing protein